MTDDGRGPVRQRHSTEQLFRQYLQTNGDNYMTDDGRGPVW